MGRKTTTIRWCQSCDIPVIDRRSCPVCGAAAVSMDLPPDDMRPAFPYDIALIRRLLSECYGCTDAPFLDDCVVILYGNASSAVGLSVIAHGRVIASYHIDMDGRESILLTLDGAMMASTGITKMVVRVKRSAIQYIDTGKNAMATSVTWADPEIAEGDQVIVVAPDGSPVASGTARMSGDDMVSSSEGMAVKVRERRSGREAPVMKSSDWESVTEANAEVVKRRVAKSVRFIREKMSETDLPPVVSFSGGKDSLAVLLLTLDAGLKLPVTYVNTGLEYDETVEYVRFLADHYHLDLLTVEGSTELFFSNLVRFGPPAKDFRWCCKTNKLGPMATLQNLHFPNGCLSLIGQRMYESEDRESHGDTWRNPWFPVNLNISPIQEWNSIHVWLYIFLRKAPYNILYTRGLNRIGCVVCPSACRITDEITGTAILPRWNAYLDEYSRRYDMPEVWRAYELWRWKSIPEAIRMHVVDIHGDMPKKKDVSDGRLTMSVQSGYSPCVYGYSVECALSKPVDLARVRDFACILGEKVEEDPDGDWISAGLLTLYAEGSMVSKAGTEEEARRQLDRMFEVIVKSQDCAGCGSCAPRCPTGALTMKGNVVAIDSGICTGCGSCLGPCPTVRYH